MTASTSARKTSTLGVVLSVVLLGAYFALIVAAMAAPDILAIKLPEAGGVTVLVAIALLLLALTTLASLIYMLFAPREGDAP